MTDAIALAEEFSMPAVEVLTGRGFVTGKSGSGKSNTASVIAEELLAADLPLLIVDTDGEYYGLKEEFELLHVGGDDRCDRRVTPEHADRLAAVALDRQVPIVLDLSAFGPDTERELVRAVVDALYEREKSAQTPFLVIVEEAHEFVPEQGGLDELGETFVRVAKRGRKRGLGICALSQRPAAVSKDYITQCNWLVWHRLTWENDTAVVARILGRDTADEVTDLDDGEAIVMTDWDDAVRRIRVRRKRTFDAGATPDLDDVDQPDFESVDADLLAELALDDEGDRDESSITDAASANAPTVGAGQSRDTADGAGTDRAAEASPASGDPANDPAWEVAQFVTYVGTELACALRQGFATATTAGTRTLALTTDVGTDAFDRTGDNQRVWTLLIRIALVSLGVVLGFGLATVLG